MKISIYTLGCKVNQYESECLAGRLTELGHDVVMQLEKADLFVINTCAVTNEAERKSRQAISRAKALSSDAKIVVCGCASEHNANQFKDIENVTYVTGTKNKSALADKILQRKVEVLPHDNVYDEEKLVLPIKTRAQLKIQDGCNNFCSYCLIPYLRGRSRSRNIENVVEEARRLCKDENVKELVVTGINITDYKIDGKPALATLLKELDKLGVRIRLGSIEESLLSKEFVKEISTLKNLCPHFHLSLQSGSDNVLFHMNRHYTSRQFLKSVKLLKRHFKNPSITTDVIVGFPTETEKDFKKTCKFVKKVGFSYLHIFPYSPRQGTPASKMKQIEKNIKKTRAKILEKINKKLHQKYILSNKGRVFDVLIEEFKEGFFVGFSSNYIKCYIPQNNYQKNINLNSFCKVKLTKNFKDGAVAAMCEDKL